MNEAFVLTPSPQTKAYAELSEDVEPSEASLFSDASAASRFRALDFAASRPNPVRDPGTWSEGSIQPPTAKLLVLFVSLAN